MIDPSIWADEDFGRLSSDAKVMFIGMISNADDEGRLPGDSIYLSATIFPFNGLSPQKASRICKEIEEKMKSATFFVEKSKKYIQLEKFLIYQSINRPTPSKYPQPRKDEKTHVVLTEQSLRTHGGLTPNRIEENRKESLSKENPPYGDNEFEKNAWEAANEVTAILNRRRQK